MYKHVFIIPCDIMGKKYDPHHGYDVYEIITYEKFKHLSMVVTFEDMSEPTILHPPCYYTFRPDSCTILEGEEMKLKEIWK